MLIYVPPLFDDVLFPFCLVSLSIWHHPKCFVDPNWLIRGLFANQDIMKNQFVMEYCGEIVSQMEVDRRLRYCYFGSKKFFILKLGKGLFIDATMKGSKARFMNHSCDPNCRTQKWSVRGTRRIGFFALKNIAKGEELTFDYQFERFGNAKHPCFCGSENCRKYLGAEKQSSIAVKKQKTQPLNEEIPHILYKRMTDDLQIRRHSQYMKRLQSLSINDTGSLLSEIPSLRQCVMKGLIINSLRMQSIKRTNDVDSEVPDECCSSESRATLSAVTAFDHILHSIQSMADLKQIESIATKCATISMVPEETSRRSMTSRLYGVEESTMPFVIESIVMPKIETLVVADESVMNEVADETTVSEVVVASSIKTESISQDSNADDPESTALASKEKKKKTKKTKKKKKGTSKKKKSSKKSKRSGSKKEKKTKKKKTTKKKKKKKKEDKVKRESKVEDFPKSANSTEDDDEKIEEKEITETKPVADNEIIDDSEKKSENENETNYGSNTNDDEKTVDTETEGDGSVECKVKVKEIVSPLVVATEDMTSSTDSLTTPATPSEAYSIQSTPPVITREHRTPKRKRKREREDDSESERERKRVRRESPEHRRHRASKDSHRRSRESNREHDHSTKSRSSYQTRTRTEVRFTDSYRRHEGSNSYFHSHRKTHRQSSYPHQYNRYGTRPPIHSSNYCHGHERNGSPRFKNYHHHQPGKRILGPNERWNWSPKRNYSANNNGCWWCGGGHVKKDCPQYIEWKRKSAFARHRGPDEAHWHRNNHERYRIDHRNRR